MNRQRNSDNTIRVFAAALAATSPAVAEMSVRVEYASSNAAIQMGEAEVSTSAASVSNFPVMQRSEHYTSWTKVHARRFLQLSKKEALGEIASEELAELETLSRFRQEQLFPRTAADIIAEIRQREAIAILVEALHACAKAIPTDR